MLRFDKKPPKVVSWVWEYLKWPKSYLVIREIYVPHCSSTARNYLDYPAPEPSTALLRRIIECDVLLLLLVSLLGRLSINTHHPRDLASSQYTPMRFAWSHSPLYTPSIFTSNNRDGYLSPCSLLTYPSASTPPSQAGKSKS